MSSEGCRSNGVRLVSPTSWGPNQGAWKPINKTPFTLFHSSATVTPLTAVTGLGQDREEGKRKVNLKSLPRPWEGEISLAHYKAVRAVSVPRL